MLKMLTFVDFIVTPNLSYQVFISDRLLPVPVGAPYQKLHTLIRVCAVLSEVLSKIRLAFDPSSSAQVARIQGEIISVLSAKQGKVGEAIWSAVVDISTQILKTLLDGQGSSDTQTPQGPSDIDEATKSVMIYVMFLENYHSVMEPIVSDAASLGKYVPRSGDLPPLTSLEMEMVSCLGEKLANKSEALPNQGLRFLFLLNNSSFIADQLHQNASYFPKSYKVDLAGKVEGYMERYMQVSWAPVLSCLINPTPSCFGKNYTPLPKFESEFQKMYTTQKLWKVPDPRLRNWLRRAIIDKVIPCYTRYLADGYGNTPLKFSPSNLQEMLQELFEG
ncbi:hypothetical protein PVAP13_7KG116600 [Panicum virgatum]|uniref:Exocyst subunit Exo70 family protein n=1 Tax=Panicum virgatum TaxID=38727 RepID=A0A8T0QCM6_PANVG|nr:hypothetical protein PVAP13_7KG116600 [Panicum virgatum]